MPHHYIVILPVREAAMTFALVVLLLYVFWFSHDWPFAAGMLGLRLFGFWLLLNYSFDHYSVRCLSYKLLCTFFRKLSLPCRSGSKHFSRPFVGHIFIRINCLCSVAYKPQLSLNNILPTLFELRFSTTREF